MKSLYIENYVKIPVEQKVHFLKSISQNEDFEISSQEVVFCEESIILDFKEDSDIKKACKLVRNYFKDNEDIKVDKIKKLRDKTNQVILSFGSSKKKIRI